jgi:hypothetical protein
MRFAFATSMVRALPLIATVTAVSSAAPATASPVFFPPDPPALGAPPPARDPANATKTAAPAELTGYVNESFYSPLAARLVATTPEGNLNDDLWVRIETYHATKVALQTELRAKIDTLREADAATRESQLAQFAGVQTPRVIGLEQVAEQIRQELVSGLGTGSVPAFAAEADRLRFAAYFLDGLSPGQRRLLRESAVESAERDTSAAGAPGALFCFSPEGSRIRLPADLPAELNAKITAYRSENSALKRELRAALETAPSAREQALAGLAVQTAPRLAALEILADEIRRGVTARKDPARAPDLPPISPELEARIATYRRDKLDLQKSLLAKVEEVTKGQPVSPGPANLSDLASGGPTTELQEKIRDAVAAYTRENAARYASLEQRKVAIRRDLARLPNPAGEPARAASADILLGKFTEALHEREIWWNYRYYQIAVLQPGLSPEQRRLLFDGALEELALPLPGAVAPP